MTEFKDKAKVPYIERFNGNIAFRKDDFKAACKHYSKALFGLKMIFDGDKQRFYDNPQEAVEFVRNIEVPVSLNLAHCYNKMGEYHFAIKYCKQVLDVDPDNVKALLRRGTAYTRIAEIQRAKEDLKKALALC